MIAMGEIFAYSRIPCIKMDRVPVTEKELNSSSIIVGDILFARQSLTLEGAGKCSIVTEISEPTVFESHLIRVRVNPQIADPFYVYYYFNSSVGRNKVKGIVEQVAAAGIRGSDLVKLTIPLPDIDSQRSIAMLLRKLDEKREINNRINDNLYQQAMALFTETFLINPSEGEPMPLYDFADYINGAAFKPADYSEDGLPIIKIAEL